MQVRVELLGLSRLVIGQREVTLDLDSEATYRDVVRELGETYPALVGNVIQSDKENLQAPNIFNLNARQMIQAKQMENRLVDELHPSEGDRIILMSMSAGG
jgi:molybdopterin converting factor small subunit